jgi:hypothetical protein
MFRYSICDPLKEMPVEMGAIDKSQMLDVFDRFPWTDMLARMKNAKESEVHFSPSLEFENKTTKQGISISIIEDDTAEEFYVFYKRPKIVAKLFGLIKRLDENLLSDRTGQTRGDARDAVVALMNNDSATLEKRWG